MIRHLKKPELVAPAGNFAMLNAVLNHGADSVYFGIGNLNMRVQAENFTVEDLPEIMRIVREHNAKAHLTLNTMLFEGELEQVNTIIKAAKQNGVNSIICWDLAAISLCCSHGIPFHISTQASISNSLSANMYHKMGAERVVVARECSLEQIKEIKANSPVEVEAFVHGAVCIAQSGRCFMSHEVFGRSGNRGDCLQNCRREYEIYDKRKDVTLLLGSDYVMSSKDLCTIEFIDQLIEAGIDAFKIEGRKRSPEYAARTTSVYRRAIDAYFEGTLTGEVKAGMLRELEEVYNRGFTKGFYLEEPGADSFIEHEGSASPVQKELLGKVLNYYPKSSIAFIQILANELNNGDKLLIIGNTTGVVELEASQLRVNEVENTHAGKGDTVTFSCSSKVRQGDKVYRIVNREQVQKYAPINKKS